MKTKIFLIAACITFPFLGFPQFTNKYFTITSATTQSWAGGAAGSGSGTNYVFNLTFNEDVTVNFDSVWITGDCGLYISGNKGKENSFLKNETYTLNASEYYPGAYDRYYYNETNYEFPVFKPPVFYKGYALIRFYVNGAAYYYAIEDMQTLPPIAYP